MKLKVTGKHVITICFVFIVIVLYNQFLNKSKLSENVHLVEGLHPELIYYTDLLVQMAGEDGIKVVITDDFRSFHEQDKLYAKGRSGEGNIVTHAKAGESLHNYGLAVDFALITPEDQVIWDLNYDGNGNSRSDWMEVVEIAKGLGFEWGGDWKHFKDYPHLQMDFGLSLRDLQKGKRPPEHSLTAGKEKTN
ncbi:M15 family metallopeptidase [Mesobacillus maritimus]|uniref:M15 family metallopeptidase n=1 Tax=Mesobacillus maritimus TaxID=1643336 RepID=UPI003850969B